MTFLRFLLHLLFKRRARRRLAKLVVTPPRPIHELPLHEVRSLLQDGGRHSKLS